MMKQQRFTESQVFAILKEDEPGEPERKPCEIFKADAGQGGKVIHRFYGKNSL